MTVKEIVEKYLKDNGFDGLYQDDICGCLSNDLAPCCESFITCCPGYKTLTENEDFIHSGGWLVGPEKPKEASDGG